MARMLTGWEFNDFTVTDGREQHPNTVQVLGIDNGTVRVHLIASDSGSPWYGDDPVIDMTVEQAARFIEELQACLRATKEATS